MFAALKQTLLGTRRVAALRGIGGPAGQSESAVKVAVHRLRKRYRELIRDEIAGTLDGSQDVKWEMRHLFSVLAER